MNSQDRKSLNQVAKDVAYSVLLAELKETAQEEMTGRKPCFKCKQMRWANQLLFVPNGRICFDCADVRFIG